MASIRIRGFRGEANAIWRALVDAGFSIRSTDVGIGNDGDEGIFWISAMPPTEPEPEPEPEPELEHGEEF